MGMGFVARFFLIVVILSFAELYLLLAVAAHLGFLATILCCVLTGVLGGSLVRVQGFASLLEIQKSLAAGHVPAVPVVSGLILLVLGALLLTPGFITDTLGFLLLIPPLRHRVAAWIIRRWRARFSNHHVFHHEPQGHPREHGPVIDVQVQENDTSHPRD